WVTLRNSINAEFEELAAAIGILSQGYSFGGQLISLALEGAQTDGSAAVDTPNPSAVIVNVSATTGVGGSNNTGTLFGDPLY
ncbi:MAG: hypothetical protein NZ700_04625, partial [Gemmataceae bacterium]|nr:hypothetical protein [Gemmataceae bacterium]MDW8264902.1 hypothetical protein [Gemmataceae bacterium]